MFRLVEIINNCKDAILKIYMPELPWPPSVNHYWNASGKARYRSPKVIAYQTEMIYLTKKYKPIDGLVSLTIFAWFPDKRLRDVDNLFKAPLDALKKAGFYPDDSVIHDLRIIRMGYVKKGRLNILAMPFTELTTAQYHSLTQNLQS